MSKLQNEIQLSFDLVANRALSAHLPNAAHDETKQALQVLRGELKKYLELVEKEKAGESHQATPPQSVPTKKRVSKNEALNLVNSPAPSA